MGWCTNALTPPGRCSGNTHVQVIRAGSPHLHSRRELEFMGCCKKLFWWYKTKQLCITHEETENTSGNQCHLSGSDGPMKNERGKRLLSPPPPRACSTHIFSISNRAGNFVRIEDWKRRGGVKGEQKQGLLRLKERERVERVCPAGSKHREREGVRRQSTELHVLRQGGVKSVSVKDTLLFWIENKNYSCESIVSCVKWRGGLLRLVLGRPSWDIYRDKERKAELLFTKD